MASARACERPSRHARQAGGSGAFDRCVLVEFWAAALGPVASGLVARPSPWWRRCDKKLISSCSACCSRWRSRPALLVALGLACAPHRSRTRWSMALRIGRFERQGQRCPRCCAGPPQSASRCLARRPPSSAAAEDRGRASPSPRSCAPCHQSRRARPRADRHRRGTAARRRARRRTADGTLRGPRQRPVTPRLARRGTAVTASRVKNRAASHAAGARFAPLASAVPELAGAGAGQRRGSSSTPRFGAGAGVSRRSKPVLADVAVGRSGHRDPARRRRGAAPPAAGPAAASKAGSRTR